MARPRAAAWPRAVAQAWPDPTETWVTPTTRVACTLALNDALRVTVTIALDPRTFWTTRRGAVAVAAALTVPRSVTRACARVVMQVWTWPPGRVAAGPDPSPRAAGPPPLISTTASAAS